MQVSIRGGASSFRITAMDAEEYPELPDVSSIPAEVAQKAKFMLVSLPANPVGSVGTPELYREIVDFCRANDILLVHDNAYSDIFDGEGITAGNHSNSSVHGMEQTIDIAGWDFTGLCFTNLVDFDALWGHRRNPIGYGEEIERFDKKLGELLPLLGQKDLLILTADHGNEPNSRYYSA